MAKQATTPASVAVPEGWPHRLVRAIERLGLRSMVTGNFGWFAVLLVAGGCIWKLESADLKEVLLRIADRAGWLGYPVAALTIWVSRATLRWREQFYHAEMSRMAEIKNHLMQRGFELPLESSVQRSDQDR